MSIESIRLSEKEKQQLVTVKRRSGIQNWNTLCRWAFCASLAEPSPPPIENIPSDSSVEMTWRVFGGTHQDLYLALLRQRAKSDGVSLDSNLTELSYFRIHLHRGISYILKSTEQNALPSLLSMPSNVK